MTETKFTYTELERFLTHAKEIAPVTSLRGASLRRGVILRHDVDFCLYPVHNLLKIEKKMGVTSTFFIMATSPTYNPNSHANRKIIREISESGFEIGLHFDPRIYGDMSHNELGKMVAAECGILSDIINAPVTSVSLHRPSGNYPLFEGYNNAYSDKIFSKECYLSDSEMTFHGNDPHEFIERARRIPVQVLLHPEHWSENGDDYIWLLHKYIHSLTKDIDESLRTNSTYKKQIKNNTLGDILLKPLKGGKNEN